MNDKARALMDTINATLKSPVLKMASDSDLKVEYLPTGVLPIDTLLQGGIPRGRFTTLTGDYCLAPNTLVLNGAYDWVPLGSLRVGDPIVAFDEEPQEGRGNQRTLQPARVVRTQRKTLPCYEVETDKGTRTVASIGHKWLALWQSQRKPVWKTTEQIGVGDKIAYFGDVWGQPDDREAAAYLAGLFDGEGWVDDCRVAFAQNPGPVLDYGIKLLEGMGFDITVRQANAGKTVMAAYIKGGFRELMRFASQIPTVRLAPKIEQAWVGKSLTRKGRNADADKAWATVTKVRYVGNREVVAIGTTTKTLIADGMYTHNSTLKSYVGLSAIAQAQQRGHTCALIDTEHSFDPDWATDIGVDVDSLILQHPESGELAIDTAEALVRGGCDLIVFDSVAATLPDAERTKRLYDEKVQPARIAQLMSVAMRKLTAANDKTAIIWINQLRMNIGVTFGNPEVATGGRSLPYYSSYIINIRKTGKITRTVKTWDGTEWKDTKETYGQKFRAYVEKSKLSAPHREVHFVWDHEQNAVDEIGYLIAVGLESGYITQNGAMWSCNGIKVKGKDKFKETVKTDSNLQQAIRASVFPGNQEPAKKKVARVKRKSSNDTA